MQVDVEMLKTSNETSGENIMKEKLASMFKILDQYSNDEQAKS